MVSSLILASSIPSSFYRLLPIQYKGLKGRKPSRLLLLFFGIYINAFPTMEASSLSWTLKGCKNTRNNRKGGGEGVWRNHLVFHNTSTDVATFFGLCWCVCLRCRSPYYNVTLFCFLLLSGRDWKNQAQLQQQQCTLFLSIIINMKTIEIKAKTPNHGPRRLLKN